ncbi:PIN domain-containing protein [Variovorax sp. YR752]|uniref:PIN domain-containing protein n=1 Tax=Variovorax sp. YR752 TaxID=1884383 RepID=UPI00359C4E42
MRRSTSHRGWGANGEAWIFYGEHEIGLLAQYMELGDRVSLVDISKPGKNSLDFHLVLYLGYLVGRHEPEARFVQPSPQLFSPS